MACHGNRIFLAVFASFSISWVVSLSRSGVFRLKTKSLFLPDRCALKIAKEAGLHEFFAN